MTYETSKLLRDAAKETNDLLESVLDICLENLFLSTHTTMTVCIAGSQLRSSSRHTALFVHQSCKLGISHILFQSHT